MEPWQIVFLVGGAVIAASILPSYLIHRWRRYIKTVWVQTSGEIVCVVSRGQTPGLLSSFPSPFAIVKYLYRTEDGPRVVTKKVFGELERKRKGDQITVYYNPKKADEHILEP